MASEAILRVPEWKVKEVDELVEKIGQSPVVGLVGIREIPASNIQNIRADMRASVEIRVVRNNIARRALKKAGADIGALADHIQDQIAMIFSETNPFRLKKALDDTKRPMPIKAGSRSPKEIVVEAGETSFSPGPMVGKLQTAGIPAAIKGGKVFINQRTVLAKEGEVVSPRMAEILQTMEIYPRDVGLELLAIYEGGLIYLKEELSVDVAAIIGEMAVASAKAFGLAMEIGYATPQTVGPLLQTAQAKAWSLVAEAAIPVPGSMTIVIVKAAANAAAVMAATGKAEEALATTSAEEVVEEEEEKEEEDMAAGLGSLFG